MEEFAEVSSALGCLDGVTVHAYPLANTPDTCDIPHYLNRSAMMTLKDAVVGWQQLASPLLAAGVPLIQGETATSAHGGCANLSNTYVAGFTFMLELGALGGWGVSQVNRQDLVGWSAEGVPSNYALLGQPGWAGGFLAPHPDYFTALLWKQLVGGRVLNSSFVGSAVPADSIDLHVWCSREGGGLVVTFFNAGALGAPLLLPEGTPSAPRREFILTSSPEGSSMDTLAGERVYLNGVLLSADELGGLSPPFPYQGRYAVEGEPITLPPLSYGFFQLSQAAPACAA